MTHHRPPWAPAVAVIAVLLLLAGFYWVVADATRQADTARQRNLAEGVRRSACDMRSAEVRDLSLLTLAVPAGIGAKSIDPKRTDAKGIDPNRIARVVQTPSSSTSNISVALGGMAPPAPRAP